MVDLPNPDWMVPWNALSNPFLDAWKKLAEAGASPLGMTPRQDGFEQWKRLMPSGAGGPGETIERAIESAKGYAAFMQSMLSGIATGSDAPANPWSDALREGLAALGPAAMKVGYPFAQGWPDLSKGQSGNAFAQAMAGLNAWRSPPFAQGDFKTSLNLPAFGLLREHQEHYQKAARAWLDYKEQMDRYNALMLDAAKRGFVRFEIKLAEHDQPGLQINSLRALYDLWVDAAEEGYAEVALSREFREVYGALVNAQMSVRSQIQKEVERVSVNFGMPTRSEIDTIGKRLQEVRREVRANASSGGLAAQVAALRSEFAAFKSGRVRDNASSARDGGPSRGATTKADSRRRKPAGPAKRKRISSEQRTPKPSVSRGARKTAKTKTGAALGAAARSAATGVAPGTFASRIEKYAKVSLGKPRAATKRPQRAK